ncbi:glutaminyl-tRNA synthase (glutamine-hydrolyzing) subunit A [Candidatus Woesebacteria bacterium RIFCSPLOWO2_01_FULL_39_23]|uniref:Glutamyl-tRNA(Gln) amidotransferase subunit A n=1 Tax=Candidatus Woesebacteria bacterium RIFCSPHIGHO2_01_FULL_40_22 TaxID=1802499 RepID=A0A1F7YJU5_9BACT|nr:MAG: glutaminyl-tRNA synthase (glutamine-hydrolyzing) subunit A [Candidatus Woesebacteria bacterium RIFCSPHIGHO2_01_FULL_40_22]OGM36572.1 MAG: glutaminyl-tRNA synthase (glutamine-hydrolyzing) subunit A [Candidatus Woesebacteria bacterium RIFCSPHIGHO2_12_FULL_38_9]OGM62644.1 MAG: glutaminyl-tRNA synthase (glutamine-hydrolyzing) subunit A [Candidatus Woesebacteria bacterium RIFCSPLOWO2_01_FULL_39_23]
MIIPLVISELHADLIQSKYSIVDLLNAYFERIESYDKKLNCFITLTKDKAYEEAERCDKILKDSGPDAFKDYPLLGVTVSYKDLFLTQGVRTTAGSRVLENYIPSYSATVVEALENAGSIMIGKTNCDAWAHGASGENSDYGPTKNPWNTDYVPGGSSSGSAAAIAANFSLVATGTDTGGSIRQPASFCGMVGFKPTYGAVSRYGIVAMASSLDSIGHFTRCIDDCERVFSVTKQLDYHDATQANFPKSANLASKPLIGLPKEYFIGGIDAEVKENVLHACEVFTKAGCKIEEISLPHTKYAIDVYYIIQTAEVSSNLGRYDGIRFGNKRDAFGDEAKRRIMLGSYVLSAGYYDAYYLKAMKVRTKIIADFDNVFNKVDALIAPVSPTPAFKIGEKVDNPLSMYLADILTVAANLSGIPAISFPFNATKNGLPLGFQIMGPRFSEDRLFGLAKTFEVSSKYKPKVAAL